MTNFTPPFCIVDNATKQELWCIRDDGSVDFKKGISLPLKTVSENYTITTVDYTILCNASAAAFSVSLPAPSSVINKILNIKKIGTDSNAVTVSGTVDGSANPSLTASMESITIQANAAGWWIL